MAAAVIALLGWMAALSVIDLRERRLPNVLTLPGAAVIVVAAVVCGRGLPALVGAVALAGAYLVVHLIDPAGMGAGDVKLALGLGALTGAFGVEAWMVAALGASLLTAVAGLVSHRRSVPHGPSMCVAAALALAVQITG
jgi:leader peptidase (prepilin peptidase)/N-methyltransferase